jgi:hypothetical protein
LQAPTPGGAAPASGAANQLDHAFGGQTTGGTFDGGSGPTDAVLPDEDKVIPHPPTPPSSASGPVQPSDTTAKPVQLGVPLDKSSASDSAQGQLNDAGNGQATGITFDNAGHDQADDANADPTKSAPPQGPPTPPSPPGLAPIDPNPPSAPTAPEAGTSNTQSGASSGGPGGPGGATSPAQGTISAHPANSEYTTYGPGDERTTGGGINRIEGGGHPISGPGIVQGAPDRPPPRNPVPPVPATGNQPPQYLAHPPPALRPPASELPPANTSSGDSGRRTSPSQVVQPEPSQPTDTDASVGAAGGAPTVSPTVKPISSDPRYAEANDRVANAQTAVANAQRELAALLAQRKAATDPAKRKTLDTRISAQRLTLARAKSQLSAAEHDLQLLMDSPAK